MWPNCINIVNQFYTICTWVKCNYDAAAVAVAVARKLYFQTRWAKCEKTSKKEQKCATVKID